jgi:hypothetical protein
MSSFKVQYRENYLKSNHWFSLKTTALTHYNCICAVCGHKSADNDVHHVKYKKLYNVELCDLRVLCRGCHNRVHLLLNNNTLLFERVKKTDSNNIWNVVLNKLGVDFSKRIQLPKNEHVSKFKHKHPTKGYKNRTSWCARSSLPKGWKERIHY